MEEKCLNFTNFFWKISIKNTFFKYVQKEKCFQKLDFNWKTIKFKLSIQKRHSFGEFL